jgi:hydrogenase-4 component B
MTALWGYAVVFVLCMAGAIAALIVRHKLVASSIAWFAGAASLVAFFAGTQALMLPEGTHTLWAFPTLGPMAIGTTRLGALFSCIAALVYFPVSLYTAGYLRRYERNYSLRPFALWYYILLAGVVGLFICRDAVSFFITWEVIAIASSALVAYEWRETAHARAAYVMLAMSEAGTVAALIAVILVLGTGHSLLFVHGAGSALSAGQKWAVFLLSFFGFGVKAGLMPVNSWLPRAHPVAPGNVSALLSGVVLNLGVYGILLVNLDLAPVSSVGFGAMMLIVGALTALVGILYATINDDLKTMLAYSSVENIGIAIAAIGAGLVFVAVGQPALAALGLAAGLYHLLNHSAYKGLLFLGASTIQAQTGERAINRLGGLIRFLPVTAFCFFIGALSIAAIPPFNGFASEWLTLEALLRSAELAPPWLRVIFSLSGAAIALTAALAITCFVKAFGMTFLGLPRSNLRSVVEAPRSMLASMYLLAAACALLGFFPTLVLAAIDSALTPLLHGAWVQHTLVPAFLAAPHAKERLPLEFLKSFHALGAQLGYGLVPGRGLVIMLRGETANPVIFAMSSTYLLVTLAMLLGIVYLCVRTLTRTRRQRSGPVWAGGLSTLLPVMTYTGTGFSNPVRVIFDAIFRPSLQDERKTIHEHFRDAIYRVREDVFVADRFFGRPITAAVRACARALARLHHGRLEAYVFYALIVLLASLAAILSA